MHTCSHCKGQGFTLERVQVMGMIMNTQQPCRNCGVQGQVVKEKCHACSGRKVVPEQKKFEVPIEECMRNEDLATFEGESEQKPDYLPGDVIFIIEEQRHGRFERFGDDLNMNVEFGLQEALLGFRKIN